MIGHYTCQRWSHNSMFALRSSRARGGGNRNSQTYNTYGSKIWYRLNIDGDPGVNLKTSICSVIEKKKMLDTINPHTLVWDIHKDIWNAISILPWILCELSSLTTLTREVTITKSVISPNSYTANLYHNTVLRTAL